MDKPVDEIVDMPKGATISPYLERPLRSYHQALKERTPMGMRVGTSAGTPTNLLVSDTAQLMLRLLLSDEAHVGPRSGTGESGTGESPRRCAA